MHLEEGIWNYVVPETPVAVLDFETTGLNAGVDRVIEVSIVRVSRDATPQCKVDTLVNPGRPVAATEIHGITDDDVRDAPSFHEIARDVANALCGCVLASYNIYFDLKFLQYEFKRAGLDFTPPHVCLMYMRPMLGLGKRCSLDDACKCHAIERRNSHMAGTDALAAALLWNIYIQAMPERHVRIFGDLAKLKPYKFVESFRNELLMQSMILALQSMGRFKSRLRTLGTQQLADITPEKTHQQAMHEYWECLKGVLSDLQVTEEEVSYLFKKQRELRLTVEDVRSLHGRAFAGMLGQSIEDNSLTDEECEKLRNLYKCLSKLGWAPGQ